MFCGTFDRGSARLSSPGARKLVLVNCEVRISVTLGCISVVCGPKYEHTLDIARELFYSIKCHSLPLRVDAEGVRA